MAEAVVESRQNRFFCHQCSVEVSPTLPDYTCPRCQSGFIEEISEEFDDGRDSDVENDPAARFAELWGRSFLDSLRMHTDPDSQEHSSSSDSNDVHMQEQMGETPPLLRSPRPMAQRTRVTVRRLRPDRTPSVQPFEGIIQQLLASLGAGVTVLGTRSGFPIGGGMFPIYGNPGDYAWGTGGLDSIITQLLNQLDGTGPPPAPKEQIESLPTVNITKEQHTNSLQCSVCMDDFKLDEAVKRLPCQHHYHTDCIVPWLELHGTCPVCRKDLNGEDTSTLEPSINEPNGSDEGSSSTPHASSSGNPGSSVFDFTDEYD